MGPGENGPKTKSFSDTSEGITESPRQLSGTSSSETHIARDFYRNTNISTNRSSEAYCVTGTELKGHQYSGVRKPSPSMIAGRLTLRTPPSGGRMGHIPGSPVYHGNSKTTVNQRIPEEPCSSQTSTPTLMQISPCQSSYRNQGSLSSSQLMCQQQLLTVAI
ncbi:uncharacterized protein LOC106469168 isoform X2 [Limulus polyphemus]|uniref:Uncharacterized protein LOC106469168 isoform X2 n=1 Tax=Limulus polyphemus TaxID=6850 RepID=A0ABM1TBQ8_LIMPO|nr:uncharacterized protein LOC106469168 isoform X2 [Limulus polyphemus]